MPAPTIGITLGNGFEGVVAQTPDMLIETVANQGATAAPFGAPIIISGGNTIPADATATAANFIGFASRQVQTELNYLQQNGAGSYVPGAPMPVMVRGSITKYCYAGVPARFGKVYLRIVANAEISTVIGGLEAAADGTNTIVVPNAYWGSAVDGNGNATVILTSANVG